MHMIRTDHPGHDAPICLSDECFLFRMRPSCQGVKAMNVLEVGAAIESTQSGSEPD